MNKTILIGEDSTVIQNLAKRILEFQQYHILLARNGHEVLALLQENDVDLVLLDITMPVMDGVQCIKAIRNLPDEEKAYLPVFAITGNAANYSDTEFDLMGFTKVFRKPLDFDELVEEVNNEFS